MSIPFGELLSPERRQAELDLERQTKLFFRFGSEADREKAIKTIEEQREFSDELKHVDNFGRDASAAHEHDGLFLHLDNFDSNALTKIEAFFNRADINCHVVDKNEWIVEPAEQQKELESRQRAQTPHRDNVVEMKPKPEVKPQTWQGKEAA